MPKLAIITVNLNNAPGLQKTMESVFEQTFTDFEYIIIDGGSTDWSKEYITTHSDKLTYWISEKDGGVYHAMNKGILKSNSEYLLFLNSGDFIIDNKILDNLFSKDASADIIYGDVRRRENEKVWDVHFPDRLTFEYFTTMSLPHQASFIRRKLFTSVVGLYDESLLSSSDWKFFLLAIYKHNCSYQHKKIIVAECDRHGISCDPKNWPAIVEEHKQAFEKFFRAFLSDLDGYREKEQLLKEKIYKMEEEQRLLGFRIHKKINNFFGKK